MRGMLANCTELAEISEWVDWMRQHLPEGGIDLPGDETSVLFATRAVRTAMRVSRYCRLPQNLKVIVIQAAIIHQCWSRRQALQKTAGFGRHKCEGIQTIEAFKCVSRVDECTYIMEAADGQHHIVQFPKSDRETLLASEIISAEVGRLVGLPAPKANVILVRRELARAMGIVSRGWPRFVLDGVFFRCLGLRLPNTPDSKLELCRPHTRSRLKTSHLSVGKLVLDILTLNSAERLPSLPDIAGGLHPALISHAGAFMNGDWPAFANASYQHRIEDPKNSFQVKSFDELETWIKRFCAIDFNGIWQLAFDLPSEWYGHHRILLAKILRKLEERVYDLRSSLQFLTHTGYFPNLKGNSRTDWGLEITSRRETEPLRDHGARSSKS
jgi:hypothetical protein